MDILCFGEPLVGFYPPAGKSLIDDVPVIKTWGGDTSNVALGVAKLGKKSAYLTKVGDDTFGHGFLQLWERNGVDTSYVTIDSERNTGLYFVSFDHGKHHLTYYRKTSAASAITAECLSECMIDAFSIVHLSGISIGMSASARETGKALVMLASELNKTVSFDVNYRAAQWESSDQAAEAIQDLILLGVTILEITNDEMLALGWGDDPTVLHQMFPDVEIIVYKQGDKGATVLSKNSDEIITVAACCVEIEDTVGAGDSFDASFLVALLNGMSLESAAKFAAVAAAHTCTGTGPLERMPTRADVERLFKETGYNG